MHFWNVWWKKSQLSGLWWCDIVSLYIVLGQHWFRLWLVSYELQTLTWTNVDLSSIKSYGIYLTHWGRVTHICVGNLTIIDSDNGLSPERRQAIIWTNAGILLIGPLGTNFSEISIGIQTFSFKKMHFKMSSAKWRPFCLGLNVLRARIADDINP